MGTAERDMVQANIEEPPVALCDWERLFGAPEAHNMLLTMHPIGRFGTPRDIAEAVLWLCSDKSSFMTGHYMVLDGGFLVGPQALPA